MQTIKSQIIKVIICLSCIAVVAGSCKKFVDVDAPETSASALSVYTSNAQAAGVVTGIYGRMSGSTTLGPGANAANNFVTGRGSVTLYTGLTGDEFEAVTASGSAYVLHYNNSPDMDLAPLWNDLYTDIYIANAAMEGITASTGVSDNMKKQLLGEARFIRAFCHFYLVNLYGDVPLVMTTDYRVNQLASRTPEADVYQQIIADLTEAKSLLTNDYRLPNGNITLTDRLRPNKAAAAALLARVYLYRGQWANAEANASELINNANYNLVTPVGNVFSTTSKEAIWQISSTNNQVNTYDGNVFLRTVAPNSLEPVSLTRHVVNSFTTGDQRKTWVDSITLATVKYYYPKKYKVKGGTANTPVTEHLAPLRLAEQYLIRAEARAKLGLLTGANSAQSDINAIRTRAGLGNTTAATEADLLLAIEQERRVELFCEMGHRWFDLRRTRRIDAVMSVISPLKSGIAWNTGMQLFPLPRTEMFRNPNLQPQNPWYN